MFGIDSWTVAWITVALVAAIVEVSIPHFGVIFVSVGRARRGPRRLPGFGLSVQLDGLHRGARRLAAVAAAAHDASSWAPAGVPSRTESLVGREGIVTHDIEATVGAGRVNVGGEDWAARVRRADRRRHPRSRRRRRRHRSGGHARMTDVVLFGIALFLLIVLMKAIKIVPQKQVKIIERLGKYHRTAEAGLNTIFPFLDSVRETIDLREQITKIEPQPVITRDNVTMEVDAVIYFVIVDPVRATYEVQNLRWGIEQLTLSALRNVIGQLDLDHTLVLARHHQRAAPRRARHARRSSGASR